MTAKEYLSQTRGIKLRLETMREQLEFLRSAAVCVTSSFDRTGSQVTRNIRRNEDAVIRVMEFEEKMQSVQMQLAEITAVINSVSDPAARAILTKRYIGGKTWDRIGREVFLCERQARRIHDNALAEIDSRKDVRKCPTMSY